MIHKRLLIDICKEISYARVIIDINKVNNEIIIRIPYEENPHRKVEDIFKRILRNTNSI